MKTIVSDVLTALSHRMVLTAWAGIATLLTVVFPLVYSFRNHDNTPVYLGLALASLILFIAVAVFVAEVVRRRAGAPTVQHPIGPSVPVALFISGLATYAVLFLYFTIKNDLFFRRIGFEGLVERSLAMPAYELIVHRSFMENATTLLCATIVILMAVRLSTGVRIYAIVVWLITFAIYSSFVVTNNRFQSAILYLGICIALGYAWSSRKWPKAYLLVAIIAVVGFSAYSFRVTENMRDEISIAGCVKVTALDPTKTPMEIIKRASGNPHLCGDVTTEIMTEVKTAAKAGAIGSSNGAVDANAERYAAAKKIVDQEARPWDRRLNSLGLVADITRPAFSRGFGYGSFWIQPLSLYYYFFADREKYREMKQSLRTNPKVYISSRYLDTTIKDTPSSILTDAYANFFLAGFIVAGVLMGAILGWTDGVLRSTTSAGAAVLAFFLMEKSLYAEKEMLTLIIDLLKFSPVPILSAILLWRVRLNRNEAGG